MSKKKGDILFVPTDWMPAIDAGLKDIFKDDPIVVVVKNGKLVKIDPKKHKK